METAQQTQTELPPVNPQRQKDLLDSYSALAGEIERAEGALEGAQLEARSVLETIRRELGKGPFTINGKSVIVLRRKGTMCTMPAHRETRRATTSSLPPAISKFNIFHIPLNENGVDGEGKEWGLPDNIFKATCDLGSDELAGGNVEMYVRADNREEAKRKVISSYPQAAFFR